MGRGCARSQSWRLGPSLVSLSRWRFTFWHATSRRASFVLCISVADGHGEPEAEACFFLVLFFVFCVFFLCWRLAVGDCARRNRDGGTERGVEDLPHIVMQSQGNKARHIINLFYFYQDLCKLAPCQDHGDVRGDACP